MQEKILSNESIEKIQTFLDTHVIDDMKNDCSVCLEKSQTNEKYVKLNCDHEFHFDCIKKWMQHPSKNNDVSSCPNCRDLSMERDTKNEVSYEFSIRQWNYYMNHALHHAFSNDIHFIDQPSSHRFMIPPRQVRICFETQDEAHEKD